MDDSTKLLVLLLAIGTATFTTAQQCGVTNLPRFSNPGNSVDTLAFRQQVLIPSYQFSCCGVVTKWGAYVQPGGSMHRRVYTATFQVWRPEGNGVYTMVGENAYPNPITLEDDSQILVDALQPFIEFKPGDVVGYYLDSTESSGSVQLDESNRNEEVYYGPLINGKFDTTAIGVSRTSLAPIIYVAVDRSDCIIINNTAPPVTTPATTQAADNTLTVVLAPSLVVAFLLGINITVIVIGMILWLNHKKAKENKQNRETFVARLSEIGEPTDSGRRVHTNGGKRKDYVDAVNPLATGRNTHNENISALPNSAYAANNSDFTENSAYTSDFTENSAYGTSNSAYAAVNSDYTGNSAYAAINSDYTGNSAVYSYIDEDQLQIVSKEMTHTQCVYKN